MHVLELTHVCTYIHVHTCSWSHKHTHAHTQPSGMLPSRHFCCQRSACQSIHFTIPNGEPAELCPLQAPGF